MSEIVVVQQDTVVESEAATIIVTTSEPEGNDNTEACDPSHDYPDDTASKHDVFTILPPLVLSLLLGFPMVVQTVYKKCSIGLYIYAVVLSVGGLLSYIIPPFIKQGFSLFTFVYVVAMTLHTSSKFISLHYFWNCFDFESLRTVRLLKSNTAHVDTNCVGKVLLRLKVTFCIYVALYIALGATKAIKIAMNEDAVLMDWVYFCRTLLYYYTFDIPFLLTQFVLSIYYCKGHIFISDLHGRVTNNPDTIDFAAVNDEYKAFRHDFKKDIWYLELQLKCRLSAAVAWIWISLSDLAAAEDGFDAARSGMYLATTSIPFIELVLSGSPATTKYHSFVKKVHDIKDLSLDLLYFLNYIAEFPFLIQIFAKEISAQNAVKLIAVFATARILTYLFERAQI
eukprot:124845_1